MKKLVFSVLAVLTGLLFSPVFATAAPISPEPVTILCYHDIADELETAFPDTVTVKEFAEQLSWIGSQGYNVISMQQYLNAKAGKEKLPAKPLLLTFDDGYLSFYKTAFPLLRTFGYPSTLAVIGNWASRTAPAGIQLMTPEGIGTFRSLKIMNEKQIREVASSGLVEIASHSFDLHKGIAANSFGSLLPAAITPVITADGYESEDAYEARISADLKRSREWIATVIGVAPRVVVWPYGRYNGTALRAARAQGFEATFGLGGKYVQDGIDVTPGRVYVTGGTRLSRFAENVRAASIIPARRHVSIQVPEKALTPSKGLESTWFDGLIENVSRSGVSHVYLSPFIGSTGCQALFASNLIPSAADVFSKISWQLQTRTGVQVLVDADTSRCPKLTESEWVQVAKELTLVGHSNGLLVRAEPKQSAAVRQMMSVTTAKDPSSLVGSTLDTGFQGFQLISIDACSQDLPPALMRSERFQYEANAVRCPARPVLEHFIRSGIRNFGTHIGALNDTQRLAMDRASFNSLLAWAQ